MKAFGILILCCCLVAVLGAETACQLQRNMELAKNEKGFVGNFVPSCDDDGSYSQVQCHGSTGFCWCADKEGNKVSESVRGSPDC